MTGAKVKATMPHPQKLTRQMAAFLVSTWNTISKSDLLLGWGRKSKDHQLPGVHEPGIRPHSVMSMVRRLIDDSMETTQLPLPWWLQISAFLVQSWKKEEHWVGSLKLIVWHDLYYFSDPCYAFIRLLYHVLKVLCHLRATTPTNETQ